ncbi:MAG: SPOR domain-containing protein [Parerythrobacter sp.]
MIDVQKNQAMRNHAVMLAVTTALATTVLAGCSSNASPMVKATAGKAQSATAAASADNSATPVIIAAQENTLAAPRDAGARADLGARYMEAGRFVSAAASFKDAIDLGDDSGRTALSYALAQTAAGNPATARTVLDQNRSAIDAADLGLALALAGDPDQGVHVLGNALRNGANTAKMRQNLAYAYALQGNWRAARLMVAEDVPADQVGDRIGEWAQTISPGLEQHRIARLLNVPLVKDAGRPAMLALSGAPSTAVAVTTKPVAGELPALAPALAKAGAAPVMARTASVPQKVSAPAPVPVADEPFAASRTVSTQYALPELAPVGVGPAAPVRTASALVPVDPTPSRLASATAAPVAKPTVAQTISAPAGPIKTAGAAKLAASELAPIGSGIATGPVSRPANILPGANAPKTKAADPAPETFAQAFAAAMPASGSAPIPAPAALEKLAGVTANFVTSPVVQNVAKTPARTAAALPKPKPEPAAATAQKGQHLVQLGSFTSEAQAKRAWGVYAKQYPQLKDYDMVITTAKVRGKTYFRVSAGGFAKTDARSMCSTVKAKGQGCITWASAKPLPGNTTRAARLASR